MIKNSFYLGVKKQAILNNLEYLKDWKQKNIIPVIKANAYGHGIIEMAKTCLEGNVTEVVVARFEEAKKILESEEFLKDLDPKKEFQILVLESIEDVSLLLRYPRIDISANTYAEFINAIESGVSSQRIHIKIDLGFGRNGVSKEDRNKLKEYILKHDIRCKGIFSHLFSASYSRGVTLIAEFKSLLQEIGTYRFEKIHLQNSAATYEYNIDFVTDLRIGVLVYGLQEPRYYNKNLEQAFFLEGKIDSIQELENLEYVAYERKDTLEVKNENKVAKIKIGYGDGFGKQYENTLCLVGKKEYRIIEVTMDNTFIEVDERVQVGDEVILYHNWDALVPKTGKHSYEELVILSERLPRKWVDESCKSKEKQTGN